ncbi:hypothetical protein GF327_06660 [Candidatus Woesearchaeota archaeon]|nr:hypothetical protein [Candidatus Woesearchaeota archaeon]
MTTYGQFFGIITEKIRTYYKKFLYEKMFNISYEDNQKKCIIASIDCINPKYIQEGKTVTIKFDIVIDLTLIDRNGDEKFILSWAKEAQFHLSKRDNEGIVTGVFTIGGLIFSGKSEGFPLEVIDECIKIIIIKIKNNKKKIIQTMVKEAKK